MLDGMRPRWNSYQYSTTAESRFMWEDIQLYKYGMAIRKKFSFPCAIKALNGQQQNYANMQKRSLSFSLTFCDFKKINDDDLCVWLRYVFSKTNHVWIWWTKYRLIHVWGCQRIDFCDFITSQLVALIQ